MDHTIFGGTEVPAGLGAPAGTAHLSPERRKRDRTLSRIKERPFSGWEIVREDFIGPFAGQFQELQGVGNRNLEDAGRRPTGTHSPSRFTCARRKRGDVDEARHLRICTSFGDYRAAVGMPD